MTVIFRIIGICLGIPPETFTWQYYDKSKKYNDVREITPLQFYEQARFPLLGLSVANYDVHNNVNIPQILRSM